jgi:hypothetical protein
MTARNIPDFVFNDASDPAAANALLHHGVVVVRLPCEAKHDFDFCAFSREQCEFVAPSTDTVMVLGGFGAFGHASSYHHPAARKLRHSLYMATRPLLSRAFPGWFSELLPDRICLRRAGTSVSAESWHRDISDQHTDEHSTIFGGWVNLDGEDAAAPQQFTCCPGTHGASVVDGAYGFAPIRGQDSQHYRKTCVQISVPPGCAVVFNERIVHCVTARKSTVNSLRVFMKYRVCDTPTPLFAPELTAARIADQAPFPLNDTDPCPPLFGKRHATMWANRLSEFSRTFVSGMRDVEWERAHGNKARVRRFAPSLKDAQLPLFSAWTEEEKQDLSMQPL